MEITIQPKQAASVITIKAIVIIANYYTTYQPNGKKKITKSNKYAWRIFLMSFDRAMLQSLSGIIQPFYESIFLESPIKSRYLYPLGYDVSEKPSLKPNNSIPEGYIIPDRDFLDRY